MPAPGVGEGESASTEPYGRKKMNFSARKKWVPFITKRKGEKMLGQKDWDPQAGSSQWGQGRGVVEESG